MPAIDFDALIGKPGTASRLLRTIVEARKERSVAKHGLDWLPMPRDALIRRAGLSVAQYQRALRTLRRKRLITDRMAFRIGVRMPHLAPMPMLELQLSAEQGGDFGPQAAPVVQLIAEQGGESATLTRARDITRARPMIIRIPRKSSKSSSSFGGATPATSGEVVFGTGSPAEKKSTPQPPAASEAPVPKKPTTVAEIMALAKPKAAAELGKSLPLRLVWRNACVDAKVGFIPALSTKELGQLRHFAQAIKPNDAEKVIEHVVGHWSAFTHKASYDAGAFNVPDKPQIGFLVKFAGPAVNLWLDSLKPKPSKATTFVPPPAPAPAPAKKPIMDKGGPKMTLEELLKSMENG